MSRNSNRAAVVTGWRSGAVAALLVLSTSGPVRANDYPVTATGKFSCSDNGVVSPLAHARIELRDSDNDVGTLGDDVMAVGFTQDDGTYTISGSGGDPGDYSWSRPDVYVQVVLTDEQGVRLTDEVNNEWNFNTPQHDHDNVQGNVTIGSFTIGTNAGGGSSRCGVWLNARAAFQDYVKTIGIPPPAGHYDVEVWAAFPYGTPWTDLDTTHWPTGYPTGRVSFHEFAHSVRHSFDGDGTHFAWDAVRFLYPRSHKSCDDTNEGFAFNEGWAEYWAGTPQSCGDGSNMKQEGNVAAALTAMEACGGSHKRYADVLRAGPEQIHSFSDFTQHYERMFGACKPGPKTGMASSGFGPPANWKAQLAAAQQSMARIDATIATLGSQLTQAQRAAAGPLPCAEDCFGAFSTVTKPPQIQAQVGYAKLLRARIARDISPAFGEGFNNRLASGAVRTALIQDRRAFVTAVGELDVTALQAEITAAAPLARRSKSAQLLVTDVEGKLARLRSGLREGKLPPSMRPSLQIGPDRMLPRG